MLIVFSGLPGTGKTTIAAELARQMQAVYLRVDTIEQAIRDAGVLVQDVGTSGYRVANGLSLSNLGLGLSVVVDCVNPVGESRAAWAEIALQAKARLINIEVICSDTQEHRRRVETREGDIPGLKPPSWESVLAHDYAAWVDAPFRLDSALISPAKAVMLIVDFIKHSS